MAAQLGKASTNWAKLRTKSEAKARPLLNLNLTTLVFVQCSSGRLRLRSGRLFCNFQNRLKTKRRAGQLAFVHRIALRG